MLPGLTYIFLVVAFVSSRPPDPVWPDKFTQTFNETFSYPALGTHKTTGTFYYDWPNRRYRVDRANGRFDRYCGFNGIHALSNTPCTQLVVDGWRWLIYPKWKSCCRCCHTTGCQILKPTWLSGAKFLGEDKVKGTYKWDQPGLQSNFYLERASDRRMLEINQVPNDIQDFDPESFKAIIEDEENVFKLPSYCKVQKCSLFSTCRAVG